MTLTSPESKRNPRRSGTSALAAEPKKDAYINLKRNHCRYQSAAPIYPGPRAPGSEIAKGYAVQLYNQRKAQYLATMSEADASKQRTKMSKND